ncbi:MAG: 30S ribosomal protein S17e [Candidatus Aenigmarchaeota archaeon]|nr:30S ribosomal protein S17e [Candidatus Aenigmarchaeota archaeon]
MGSIKNKSIRTLGKDLVKKQEKSFSNDFAKNKEALNIFVEVKSKKTRNMLAGYITNEMKRIKKKF